MTSTKFFDLSKIFISQILKSKKNNPEKVVKNVGDVSSKDSSTKDKILSEVTSKSEKKKGWISERKKETHTRIRSKSDLKVSDFEKVLVGLANPSKKATTSPPCKSQKVRSLNPTEVGIKDKAEASLTSSSSKKASKSEDPARSKGVRKYSSKKESKVQCSSTCDKSPEKVKDVLPSTSGRDDQIQRSECGTMTEADSDTVIQIKIEFEADFTKTSRSTTDLSEERSESQRGNLILF